MSKGEATRAAILEAAMAEASTLGLNGISIGELAGRTGLSKSGLFAHFGSKEALQQAVLQAGMDRFLDEVWRPALAAPRGVARLRTVLNGWLDWVDGATDRPGGCLLIAASTELDDRPGPLRDFIRARQRDWQALLAGAAKRAIDSGELKPDTDPAQFAFEMHGLVLGYRHSRRLLDDPEARTRVAAAFEALLQRFATHPS